MFLPTAFRAWIVALTLLVPVVCTSRPEESETVLAPVDLHSPSRSLGDHSSHVRRSDKSASQGELGLQNAKQKTMLSQLEIDSHIQSGKSHAVGALLSSVLERSSSLIGHADVNGGWCADQGSICQELWWCSWPRFVASSIMLCCAWGISFYFLSYCVFPLAIARQLRGIKSKYEDEECPYWFASHVQSTILAIIVVRWAAGPTFRLAYAPTQVQFGHPHTQAHPFLNEMLPIAHAAHIFLCYIVTDLAIGIVHRLLALDMVIHHVVFVVACLIITYDCFATYLAGVLLLMEVSTVFLNYFSFFRNRLGYEDWTVKLSFGLFAGCFILFRLLAVPYITYLFASAMLRADAGMLQQVSRAHLLIISSILVTAATIQYVWAMQITRKVLRVLIPPAPTGNSAA
mmetsp:Transcript_28780/g.66896  ORF Transcript_28780/g.66896 Transcript_28780/m.66896 type:complete len:401 (+) Transcript_28780:53-1255(+)